VLNGQFLEAPLQVAGDEGGLLKDSVADVVQNFLREARERSTNQTHTHVYASRKTAEQGVRVPLSR